MNSIEKITVRRFALDHIHRLCTEANVHFFMSHHFLQRINLRAINQDEVFANLHRAVRFMLSRKAEFSVANDEGKHPTICVEIGAHRFFLKVDTQQLTGMTYYYNQHPTAKIQGRLFRLKSEATA